MSILADHDHVTFGSNDIKALYEAVEAERHRLLLIPGVSRTVRRLETTERE